MRIGVGRYIQNYAEVIRARDGEPAEMSSDATIYDQELALAALAEPLGFDTSWSTSHFFTPYQMTGSALQQATFMAGRTSRIDVGTMVVILPWHHPLHVATEIAVLDHMLAGRRLFVGVGKGAFRREFEAFGVSMDEAEARFTESVEIVQIALSRERFTYSGRFHQLTDVGIRPRPRNPDRLLADMSVAWSATSPLPPGAHLGLDVLTTGNRNTERHMTDFQPLNELRVSLGLPAARPVLVALTVCAESDGEARELIKRHESEFQLSGALEHGTSGFEPSAKSRLRDRLRSLAESVGRPSPAEMHLWGSPRRILARLDALRQSVHPREVIACFRFGDMPHAAAEKSMRLFASRVLPVVHEWPDLASEKIIPARR